MRLLSQPYAQDACEEFVLLKEVLQLEETAQHSEIMDVFDFSYAVEWLQIRQSECRVE